MLNKDLKKQHKIKEICVKIPYKIINGNLILPKKIVYELKIIW